MSKEPVGKPEASKRWSCFVPLPNNYFFSLLNLVLKRLLGYLRGSCCWTRCWCALSRSMSQLSLPVLLASVVITAGDVSVEEVVCNPTAACQCCLVITHPGCCWRSSTAGSSGSPRVKCPAKQASSQTRWLTFLSLLFTVSCAEMVIKVITDNVAPFPFLSSILMLVIPAS